ncbi:MAG TPA: hypothetical protein VIN10_04650 [Bacteroidales bacterium]
MKPTTLSAFLAFFMLCSTFAFSQKSPIKFGDVSMEDLEMTECDIDPSAAAVVLCSYGRFNADQFKFYHNYRVKIFKKEGYNLASRKFATSNEYSLRGKTYNLVDGKIVEDKLNSDNVFREKITDYNYILNVAMPNVKEGSIIDLEIVYDGFPSNWYFQEDIPVKWAELRIEPHPYLTFRKNVFGYEPMVINEEGRWAVENIPAFKEEPFMDSRENYITKFEFDITSISVPGRYYENIASTWEDVSETLMDASRFGEILKTSTTLNKTAKEIDEMYPTQEEKLKAAIEYVHQVEFNGRRRVEASEQTFNTVLYNKTGNSADINLMLIKLLNKMNFFVYPVVLSTKENGFLSPIYPSLNKLDYVVAYIKMDENYYLVDATDKLLPYYMLPERCLNWRGILVDDELTQWVDLNSNKTDKELVYYDLKLEEDNSFSGKLSNRRNDYAAYKFRKKYGEYAGIEDYTAYLHEKNPGLTIYDVDIQNLNDVYSPIMDNYTVKIENQVYQMDSILYLELTLFEQMEENPFKAEIRKYPVDFAVPIEKNGIVKITIPDNYEVMELPSPVKFALTDDKASFIYSISQMGNIISLQYALKINNTLFVLDQYNELKAFYNEVIKKEAEPVVLKIKSNEI